MPTFLLTKMTMKNDYSLDDFLDETAFCEEISSQIALYYFCIKSKREIKDGMEDIIFSLFNKYCKKFEYYIGEVRYFSG
jgi:hypothetical protein